MNGKNDMDKEHLTELLREVMGQIEDCPGSNTEALSQIAKKHEAFKDLQKIVSNIHGSIGAIRLLIKYLVFDLEATRRERDQLRMLLGDRNDSIE